MNVRSQLLYPSLVVAAISVTLLSITGIAALTGHLPSASAEGKAAAEASATVPPADGEGVPHYNTPNNAPNGLKPAASKLAAGCNSCGTVESVRLVERQGSGSGLGAVAGGLAGALLGNQIGNGNGRTVATLAGAGGGAYLGNEVEKNSKKSVSYKIRVRMDGGELRTLYQHEAPGLVSGDRVRVANGVAMQLS